MSSGVALSLGFILAGLVGTTGEWLRRVVTLRAHRRHLYACGRGCPYLTEAQEVAERFDRHVRETISPSVLHLDG